MTDASVYCLSVCLAYGVVWRTGMAVGVCEARALTVHAVRRRRPPQPNQGLISLLTVRTGTGTVRAPAPKSVGSKQEASWNAIDSFD
jgi:hypothetical protein